MTPEPQATSLMLTLSPELLDTLADLIAERLAAATPESSLWLDVEAACAYLGFSRDKLYKLSAAGAIPCRKKRDGQRLLFHRGELDAWVEDEYPRVDRLG